MTGPRERLVDEGVASLSDVELLVVLLGTGVVGTDVHTLARRLLEAVGDLNALVHASPSELAAVPGVGPGKAARVVASIELGRRALTRPLPKGRRLVSSRDVDAALRPRLAREEVEHFFAILLDAKHRPTGTVRLSTGSLVACPVDPATVFRVLVRQAAAAVVFVHNHPSGHPDPSPEDLALTHRLRDAGDLLGVEVLDHVIIGSEGYFSFLDAGLLRRDPHPSREKPCEAGLGTPESTRTARP
ncbi:MAG: DNA repair protein RadC [Sandaracinus sp.]|nr:DNA repair protein RadC [Sandaracinus sp.]